MQKINIKTFLSQNACHYTLNELSAYLSKSKDYIRHICNELQIKYKRPLHKNADTIKFRKQFIIDNFQSKGAKYCAEQLNISVNYVTLIASKLKLKRIKKYYIDPSKYENIDARMAYFLGYIWADGCLFERSKKSMIFRFSIVSEDFEDIKSIIDYIGSFGIKTIKKTHLNKPQTVIYTQDTGFCAFLKSNDFLIKSGASPDKLLSKIPQNLRNYWWRGYLDGDGCIFYKRDKAPFVSFTSSINQDWSFCKRFLLNNDIEYKIYSRKRNKSSGSKVVISSYRCIKLLEMIYRHYNNDEIGLKRKHAKYLSIRQHILNSKDSRLNSYKIIIQSDYDISSKST